MRFPATSGSRQPPTHRTAVLHSLLNRVQSPHGNNIHFGAVLFVAPFFWGFKLKKPNKNKNKQKRRRRRRRRTLVDSRFDLTCWSSKEMDRKKMDFQALLSDGCHRAGGLRKN